MRCCGAPVADPPQLPEPDSEQIAALVGSTTRAATCSEAGRQHGPPNAGAATVRAVRSEAEPQKRIGELLRAFDGGWVRSDILGIVASAKNFQEDWQRRMRDLRFLGWDYRHEKRYDQGSRGVDLLQLDEVSYLAGEHLAGHPGRRG
jgi:hypothetical protein